MSTIKDVAKLAGVSISTASLALNNHPHVLPDTRKKIMDAASSLNYYPHAAARNLKTKRTLNVGVFIYAFGGPVFPDILEGIRQALHEEGFNIIVSSGRSSVNFIKEKQIDGAIIFDSYITDDMIKLHASSGMPIFVLDRHLSGKNIYSSLIDNEGLMSMLIEKLISKGYKDFSYVSGPERAFNNVMRESAFMKTLKRYNIRPQLHFHGDFTIEGGYQAGMKMINEKILPEVAVCANDESAIGLIKAFHEKGFSVPKDIKVTGFDHILLSDLLEPLLTTVSIDHFAWGNEVASALVSIIKGQALERIPKPQGKLLMRSSA